MKKARYDATVKALHELRAGWAENGIRFSIVGNAINLLDNQHEALACKDAAIAEQARQLKAALALVERYRAWVDDLQSGMYVNCVYCGHRYGPTETTPVSMADALKEHIEHCPEHPASKLKAELEQVKRERDAAVRDAKGCHTCANFRQCDPLSGHAKCLGYNWRGPCPQNGGTEDGI